MQIDMWLTHLFTQAEYEMFVGAETAVGFGLVFRVELSGLFEKAGNSNFGAAGSKPSATAVAIDK